MTLELTFENREGSEVAKTAATTQAHALRLTAGKHSQK